MNNSSIEQRITALENQNQARKVAKKVAGSLVKFASKTSQTFSVSVPGSGSSQAIRIKFTAKNTQNGMSMTGLKTQVASDPNFANIWPMTNSYTEIQAGDGSVVVDTQIATLADARTFYVRAIATGTTDGDFSQV